MLGMGFWEIVIILLVALIALGHERCIRAAKKAGTWLRTIQREFGEAHQGIEDLDLEFKGDPHSCQHREHSQENCRKDSKPPPT